MIGMCGPSPLLSNRRVMELSNPDLAGGSMGGIGRMAMPCPPTDRRGSGTSSLSSAYTVSRRSSVVSPYLSSRRSSEVSQVGTGGHCHSVIGNDIGGDPLSPEASHRTGLCQNTSGLPGLPSLTPAEQYSLKAKYAAATGGPPPTPLPNMEQPCTPSRRFLSEYDGQLLPPFLHQVGTRRLSANTEYGTGVIYPHQAPGNNMRRASDPVRSGADPQGLPKVQRFNSLSNMTLMGRRNALQHCGSDANITRHMYSPRPPSITENVIMEAMAMEPQRNTTEGQDHGSMRQGSDRAYLGYQQSQSHPHSCDQLSPGNEGMGCLDPSYQPQMQGQYHSQRGNVGVVETMGQNEISNTLLQQAEYSMSTCQLSPSGPQYPSLGQPSEGSGHWGQNGQLHNSHVGIQASMQFQDAGVQGQQYSQGLYDPITEPNHQRVNIKPELIHPPMGGSNACQNAKALQQHHQPSTMELCQQGYAPQTKEHGLISKPSNPSCDFVHGQMKANHQQQQSQGGSFLHGGSLSLGCAGSVLAEEQRSQTPMLQVKEMMVRNYVQSQQALLWEQQQEQHTANSSHPRKPESMEMGAQPAVMQHSPQDQQLNQNIYHNGYPGYSNQNVMSPSGHTQASGTMPVKEHMTGMQDSSFSHDMLPHPPQSRKPLSRQNSLSQQANGAYLSSPPNLSPGHSTASPRRSVRLPPVHQQQQHSDNFYYSGQIHMHHNIEKSLAPPDGSCRTQQHHAEIESSTKAASMAYPQSASMNTLENLDLENAQIDFASIIEDPDPSSYSPVNPGLGNQSSSQASSRLTTPQNSITLPSNLSNMAIGDMTSMLTSLAGENKYLNTMT